MVDKYDEDLYENPFFLALQTTYQSLNETATSNCWTLCIPRYSTVEDINLTESDVKDHVIISPKSENDPFTTWSGKKVIISDGTIQLKVDNKENKVPILFEETFYNNNDESYKVLCVGWLLNKIFQDEKKETLSIVTRPDTYEDCVKLLFDHPGGKKSQDVLDKLLDSFSKSYQLSSDKFVDIVDIASTQFTKLMQTVLKDTHVRRQAQTSQGHMDNLKFAVEAYMMQAIHKELFKVILTKFASQDTEINKMRRNLVDLTHNHLGVNSDFISNIVPARKELAKLNSFTTPFGRMKCLKRVVSALSKPAKQENLDETVVMTTDDFLPMLIFLIIKSDIPNWMANMMYMKHFHFSRTSDDDEYLYYLTTIEAGLEHIKSGKLNEESNQANIVVIPKQDKNELNRQLSSNVIERFFHYVQCGDESAVITLLRKSKTGHEDVSPLMCHPLCGCDKCLQLQSQAKTDENLVTAYTRDDRGYTALHIAALHGQAHLIDVLIKNGSIVNASDYLGLTPLHLACQKGYQNIILLLLHFKADVMMTDGTGNTPLHLCVDNGHEDCVKGLVFSDNCRGKLNICINAQNERGDTPLHLAAKWGYGAIVNTLLENGADVSVRNRKKQTALSLAQNSNVVQIFHDFQNQPRVEVSKSYSQSDLDYGYIKVIKSGQRTKSRSDSTSLPTTPIVESLDGLEERQINKLYKAIEDCDIPLVQYYLGWTSVDSEESESINSLDMCHPLCQCDKCTKVQKISGNGMNGIHVRIKDKKGYTPLHRAVLANSLSLVHLFVTKGAKVNEVTAKSITPLHLACYLGHTDVANYLVGNGATVNVKDSMLDTPLHLCCYKGFLEILDMLLQNHAMVNPVNVQGDTPLHIAVKSQNLRAVQKLVKAGANISIRNKESGLPVFYAKNPDIIHLLNDCSSNILSSKDDTQCTGSDPKETNDDVHRKVHHIVKATEERDLEALHKLCQSIRTFDPQSNLRHTFTKDRSSAQLADLQRQVSITTFDLSSLRHVHSVDKSEPLYIYKLTQMEHVDGRKQSDNPEIKETSEHPDSHFPDSSDNEATKKSLNEDENTQNIGIEN